MADGAGLCHFDNLEKVGMDGGLSTGELDDIGMAFIAHDGIEHFSIWRRGIVLIGPGYIIL